MADPRGAPGDMKNVSIFIAVRKSSRFSHTDGDVTMVSGKHFPHFVCVLDLGGIMANQ